MKKGEEKTLSCELPLPEAGELLGPVVSTGVVFSFYAGTEERRPGMYELAHLN